MMPASQDAGFSCARSDKLESINEQQNESNRRDQTVTKDEWDRQGFSAHVKAEKQRRAAECGKHEYSERYLRQCGNAGRLHRCVYQEADSCRRDGTVAQREPQRRPRFTLE